MKLWLRYLPIDKFILQVVACILKINVGRYQGSEQDIHWVEWAKTQSTKKYKFVDKEWLKENFKTT